MTLRTKILPAPVAPAALARAALQGRLDEALQRRADHGGRGRRLRQVDAPGGLGPAPRRRLVHARDRGRGALDPRPRPRRRAAPARARSARRPGGDARLRARPRRSADEGARADAFAAALSEALQERLRGPLALVLDDLHALAPERRRDARAVEALCRQAPADLHVVLASRTEPPFSIDRLRGQGQVLELGGADLAFDADEVRGGARGRARRRRARARRDPARGHRRLARGRAPRLRGDARAAAGAARRGGRAPAPARRRAVRLPGARGAGAGGAGRARAGPRRRAAGAGPSRAVRRARGRGGARRARLARAPRAVRREPTRTAGSRRRA